jgi:hypothetical protein
MAPLAQLAHRTLLATSAPALASHHFARRGLTVNHTQGVTLGVICAYVVVIALLWNLPYVRWVLWPFKVRIINLISIHLSIHRIISHHIKVSIVSMSYVCVYRGF